MSDQHAELSPDVAARLWAAVVNESWEAAEDAGVIPAGAGGTFTCCETPMPWPTGSQDRVCPECGTVWEHDGIDLGAGARIKPEAAQPDETLGAQLAGRAHCLARASPSAWGCST